MSQGKPNPDPGSLFDSQFIDAIQISLDVGDNVVIKIDNNDDVRSSTLAAKLLSLGLVHDILTQHAPASPPATRNCNHSCTPIDTLWVSPGLTVLCSGYAPFDSPFAMTSDHRLLWIKLDNSSLLGKHLPSVAPVRACCIQCNDPRSRSLYANRVVLALSTSGLLLEFSSLEDQTWTYASAPLSTRPALLPPLQQVYDTFYSALDDIRLATERKLRPLYNGNCA